jgi:hypothetical protein
VEDYDMPAGHRITTRYSIRSTRGDMPRTANPYPTPGSISTGSRARISAC